MRFKEFIKESIIDIPRKTYARPVFDDAETGNPKLKPSVQKQVLDGIKTFERFKPSKIVVIYFSGFLIKFSVFFAIKLPCSFQTLICIIFECNL